MHLAQVNPWHLKVKLSNCLLHNGRIARLRGNNLRRCLPAFPVSIQLQHLSRRGPLLCPGPGALLAFCAFEQLAFLAEDGLHQVPMDRSGVPLSPQSEMDWNQRGAIWQCRGLPSILLTSGRSESHRQNLQKDCHLLCEKPGPDYAVCLNHLPRPRSLQLRAWDLPQEMDIPPAEHLPVQLVRWSPGLLLMLSFATCESWMAKGDDLHHGRCNPLRNYAAIDETDP
mmetsp:Transcript_44857/g.97736  ORF Transcript_44857/g.97736 Transcript_44857/m.97736 type:complete len:226 (-) Transcript_44857:49-726(-)